jgi:hypothetical protein
MQAIALNANRFPLRLWVIDNSSSMQTKDAHVLRGSTLDHLEKMDCTRWQEAQESVGFFCNMAATLQLPTRFTMLNDLGSMFGPQTFSVAENGPAHIPNDFAKAMSILQRAYPSGATPLAKHVTQIRNLVAPMASQLQREGKMISVILATDGLPSDDNGNEGHVIFNQFVQALKSLEGLPVWVVVRLCTDDDRVFDFYNSIDAQLNLPYDVLDDFFGEALEVYLRNPWLNYALPLHRFRESGLYFHVLDALDEEALSFHELHQLCVLLFQQGQSLPDPARDWLLFLHRLAPLLSQEKWHSNPITKTRSPWIDLRRLHLVYGRNLPFPQELHQPMPQTTSPYPQSQSQPQQQQPPQNTPYGAPTSSPPRQPYPPQQQPPPYSQPSSGPGMVPTLAQQQQQQQQQQHFQQQPTQPPFQQHQQQPEQPFQAQTPGPFPQQQAQAQRSQQPQAPPSQPSAPPQGPSSAKYQSSATGDPAALKHGILQWAVLGNNLKPIDQLLGTLHQTFPPVFGVPHHDYFAKYKPFSADALMKREPSVMKRGKFPIRLALCCV